MRRSHAAKTISTIILQAKALVVMNGKKRALDMRNGTKGIAKRPAKTVIFNAFLDIIVYYHPIGMPQTKDRSRSFLRFLSRLLHLDMFYITQGGTWTTLRFLVGIGASVATTIAFGNLLPREVYGNYSYLLSLAGSLSFLTLSGVSTGVIRAVAKGNEEVVPYAVNLQLRYNLLAVLTIAGASLYYGFMGNEIFTISLLMLAVSVPLSAAYFTYESALIGLQKFDLLTKVTALSTFVSAGLTIITISLTQNIFAIVAVYALGSLIPNLFIYYYVAKKLKKGHPDTETIRELRDTSFHLTGAGLVSTLAMYVDKIILFQVAGPAALAVYGFSIAGPEKLKGLIKNWASIALPKLTDKTHSEMRKIFYKRFGYLFLLGMTLCGIYILLAPTLFRLVLPKYLDAVPYSQAYALSLIILPPLIYIGTVFYALNMLRAVYINSVGSQVMRIALFAILGWQYKTWGLVIAAVLTYTLSCIYGLIIWEIESRRLVKMQ